MKKKNLHVAMIFTLLFGMAATLHAGTVHQFDVKAYDKIAKKTIGRIITGNVDADKMITDMRKLVELGVAGCGEHMGEAETPAEEKKVMQITIDNAQTMSSLSLAEIEPQWHEGGLLKGQGVDISQFDHFSEVLCHYDAVVHPATAIIALEQYKKTGKEDLLEQVQAELAEVREHLKHLE